MRVSVIIPVYNEETTIGPVLDAVAALDIEKEVIVVDDGSTDGTAGVLHAHASRPTISTLSRNGGKGAAIRHAIALSTGDVVVIQDADLELSADTIVPLVVPIAEGRADAVYGSRFIEKASLVPLPRRLVNRMLTRLANVCFGTRLTDVMTAHKAIRGELVRQTRLACDGFEIEIEITAALAHAGARFTEIPSHYHPRTRAEGKKIRWTDTWTVATTAVRHRRRRPNPRPEGPSERKP